MKFDLFLRKFKFASKDQENGILGFRKFFRTVEPCLLHDEIVPLIILAYLIEKQKESDEYFREFIGTQIGSLENQIKLLQDQVTELRQNAQKSQEKSHPQE